MVPAQFSNYFMAMAGAGAALIGLLFVAISINPERTFGLGARVERQATADNAFSALANAFFISAAALIPGQEIIGPTAAVLASVSLVNSGLLAFRAVPPIYQHARRTRRWRSLMAMVAMVLISFGVYGDELSNAITLVHDPAASGAIFVLATLMLVVYGIALIRAWELLGAPRSGISGWLNPLAGLEADEATPSPIPTPTPLPTPTPAHDSASATATMPSAAAPATDTAPHTPA